MTLRLQLLHAEVGDAGGPISQSSASAAAGEVSYVSCEGTGLRAVLTGNLNRISVDGGSSIVAPARTDGIDLREVSSKAVIRTGARGCNVHVTCSSQGVERGISCARVVVLTEHGECNHSASAGRDANSRIGHVI